MRQTQRVQQRTRVAKSTMWAVLPLALLVLGGCRSTGVGDPCVPESVPADGFQPGEAYLETSSVQCRTRVCMVYQFGAASPLDPSLSQEECLERGLADCSALPTEEQIDQRVYCPCRCSADPDSNTPTCECGDGFTCQDDLLTLGGDGIRGGYCVRDETLATDS